MTPPSKYIALREVLVVLVAAVSLPKSPADIVRGLAVATAMFCGSPGVF